MYITTNIIYSHNTNLTLYRHVQSTDMTDLFYTQECYTQECYTQECYTQEYYTQEYYTCTCAYSMQYNRVCVVLQFTRFCPFSPIICITIIVISERSGSDYTIIDYNNNNSAHSVYLQNSHQMADGQDL